MEIAFVKTDSGSIPAYESDYENYKKIKFGEIFEAEIRKPRNLKFHRKFMGLIKLTFENIPNDLLLKYPTFDDLRYEITILSGYFDWHYPLSGNKYKIAKSINFQSMDNVEFEKLYNSAINVIIEKFIIGADKELIREEIINFM
jgi:hypothetical protein